MVDQLDRPGLPWSWDACPVLVTGAGGFIGSHLVAALETAGAEVTALVHYHSEGRPGNLAALSPDRPNPCRVVWADVTDAGMMDSLIAGQQVVFHLAALIGIPYSYQAPESYLHTNIEGTLRVLNACRQHYVQRVIVTSTSEVYGTAQTNPISEAHPLQPQSPYAATKVAADQLAASYWHSFDLPVVTVRPFNTFGPRQSARAVIPTIISQALSQPVIRLGTLESVRDLLFVTDTVAGFLAAGLSPDVCGQTFNLGTGRGHTIKEVVDTVQELLETDLPVVTDEDRVRPSTSEVWELVADASAAKRRLGWEPSVSLAAGLETTIDYIRGHLHDYAPERYQV